MVTRSPLVSVMVRAAEKAGRSLVRDFGEVEALQVSRKGPADFVSQADLKSERILREELSRARPGYGLLMEESGTVPGEVDARFLVDPLDGTTNFLHGIPHWAISVAAEQKGRIVAGVIYNPVTNDLFWSEKGQGAFLNDRRLRVSGRRVMADGLFACGAPFLGRGDIPQFLRELAQVLPHCSGIRRPGAAALDLAWVAAGRFDGFWERGLAPWDVAAGIVLVQEAGGFVSEIEGGKNPLTGGSILAANTSLHLPLGTALRQAREADAAAG